MKYCERCGRLTKEERCPECRNGGLREPKEGDWCLLAERGEMFAELALGILSGNGIPCTSSPVEGRAVSPSTGLPDTHRIYVPWERLHEAEDLMKVPFSGGDI